MGSAGSVLIVDDDLAVSEMIADFLVGSGYAVDAATHGGDALMLAQINRPDAVLLDIKLPDASGAELLPRFQALDRSIAVVMVSGTDDEALARSLLKAGAFDYVRKPFDLDTLANAVSLAVTVGQERPPSRVVVPFRREARTTGTPPAGASRATSIEQTGPTGTGR